MKKSTTFFFITLVVCSLVLLVGLLGCGSGDTTSGSTSISSTSTPVSASTSTITTMPTSTTTIPQITDTGTTTQLSPGQIIAANAVEASTDVATFKMDMDMTMVTEVIGGEDPGKMEMETTTHAEMNIAEQKMKMVMDIVMDIPDMGEQTVSSSFYMVAGWMYMKVSVPGIGDQWMKMRYDETEWEQQDQFGQQIEFLKSALNVTQIGTETVEGILCDVVQVEPDMSTLADWVMAQQSDESAAQLADVDLAEVFKTFTIKYYVARDSSLPVKCEMDIVMEMTPEEVGESSGEYEKMTMEITATVLFYDYGEPVDTNIPPEAEGAIEVGSD